MIALFHAVCTSLKNLWYDKNARSAMIVAICIYALLYPQPYANEVVRNVPIAVVDSDQSTASREFLRRIDDTDSVAIHAANDNLLAAQELFYAREVFGVVLVPAHFERDLLGGLPSSVAVFGDGGHFTLYQSFAAAVRNASQSLGTEVRIQRLVSSGMDSNRAQSIVSPLEITAVPLFNPHGGFATYILPAAFVLILQQTLLTGIGLLHAGRPQLKGLELIASPLAYILLYLMWIVVTRLLVPAAYGISRVGDILPMLVVALPFLTAVTAMGFALLRVFPTRASMMFFLLLQGLPLFFLSGISWPTESIPDIIRLIALAVPSTSATAAFVQVDQLGATLHQVLPSLKLLAVQTLLYGAIAVLPKRSKVVPTALR